MTREEIYQLANKWIEELWQKRNIEAIDSLHSPDFVDHSPAGRPVNNEGYLQGMMDLFNSFPDFYTTIDGCLIDTEKNEAAVRWSARGTFKAPYLGFKPSGKEVYFKGIDILKVADGKITDRWGEWDGFNVMEQLLESSIGNVIRKNK